MNIKLIRSLALTALLATGAAVGATTLTGTARATNSDENREATALQTAKVTLSQAIATAEGQTGGRAYDAGVDIKNGQVRIAIETNGAKGVQTVTVDAQSGQVLSTRAGGEAD